jgi:hypothetical protein
MASVSYRAKLLSIDLRASYHDSVSHSDGGLACNNHNVVLGMTLSDISACETDLAA